MKKITTFIAALTLSGCAAPTITTLPVSEDTNENGSVVLVRNEPLQILSPNHYVHIDGNIIANVSQTEVKELPLKSGSYTYTTSYGFFSNTQYELIIKPHTKAYLILMNKNVLEVTEEGYKECQSQPFLTEQVCLMQHLKKFTIVK
ncbi:hypothetical protein PVK63_10265 [Aliivibrio sp. S2TY2]|uniref:hypothetical protein n=1 Tax=unclassified Aliivibrio TaxID=2645654 RepID=UPI0023786118|nr:MULTISPECIES: hypothetical protein [unclassified Aliivibrio]MDD9175256.1 hypothetical protein [Aliivibrio sp. S3TY1]MDD9192335.1 hypothetical protein [Aliivibrio sp. S2TY2]